MLVKTNNLFRFTIQIPATTPENCKVGDFLVSLKNKKARFIVSVIGDYLDNHPELLTSSSIVFQTQPSITESTILAMIKKALEDQPSAYDTTTQSNNNDLAKSMLADIQSLF